MTVRRRRSCLLLLTALTLVLPLLAATTASAAPPQQPVWHDSGGASTGTVNCHGASEVLSVAHVGWEGAAPPPVDSVYYVHVWWGVAGNPCPAGGARVAPELFLPEGTRLAISPQNPVTCHTIDFRTTPVSYQQLVASECPQVASVGPRGGHGFYAPSGAPWPTPQSRGWDLWVPVTSTVPLDGLVTSPDPFQPCRSCLTAAVWSIDGVTDPWAYPRVGVRVG